jgi:hypothetical protein
MPDHLYFTMQVVSSPRRQRRAWAGVIPLALLFGYPKPNGANFTEESQIL